MPSVAKLQKETVPTANWSDLWVLGYLTEAKKRRILFTKMPPSWHRTIQLTATSRELQLARQSRYSNGDKPLSNTGKPRKGR